jgi:hypothetical protein
MKATRTTTYVVLSVDVEKQLAANSLWPPVPQSILSTPIHWFLLKAQTNFYLIEWTVYTVISSLLCHVVELGSVLMAQSIFTISFQ